jgi:hypothetical protein
MSKPLGGRRDGASPDNLAVSILVGGDSFQASAEQPFVFGRLDSPSIVGLDPNDMGISGVAGSVEFAWRVWWVVNLSRKRPLLIEHPGGRERLRLDPGERHALTAAQMVVLVPGEIFTHVIELVLPDDYVAAFQVLQGESSSGTLLSARTVKLSELERDALIAVFAGYLEAFPRRREHPNSYEEAQALLGPGWSAAGVRKAVERVKRRYADKEQLYFTGPHANYDLAAYLISNRILTGADLHRITGRRSK